MDSRVLKLTMPKKMCTICREFDPRAGFAFARTKNACSETGCFCDLRLKRLRYTGDNIAYLLSAEVILF